jgi:hypothetical protein
MRSSPPTCLITHGFLSAILLIAGAGCRPDHVAGTASVAPRSDGGPRGDASIDAGETLATSVYDALFVGNSFIFVNDVAGHYRTIANALAPPARVEEVTAPGYRLAQHAENARTDGTALAGWLRTGTPEDTSFDVVVLQEQSQIGGFPLSVNDRQQSIAAATELAALAHARSARVILYATWGYEHGDPLNSLMYDTYLRMQDLLDEGYQGLAAHIKDQGIDVRVAPVGGAFRTVYEEMIAAGTDPLVDGSDFDLLYEDDGVHPSLRGAYLAACVVAGTIDAARVPEFVDESRLGPQVSDRLRSACARALAEPRWAVPDVRRPDAVFDGDAAVGGRLGAAVAVSGDGTRVLIGSVPTTARVFVRAGDGWEEEARWSGTEAFGSSLALNADGSRALVSAPLRLFQRSGSTWTEEAPFAEVSGTTLQPAVVALNADGRRALLSGPGAGPPGVVARAFVYDGAAWTEEPLVVTDPSTVMFNPKLAIDGAGERAIVAARSPGLARVFVREAGVWAEEAVLSPGATSAPAAVALSANGRRALVVVPGAERAIAFTRNGGTWTEEATVRIRTLKVLGGLAAAALSADGDLAFVGVAGDSATPSRVNASGSVRVFALDPGAFRETFLLVASTAVNAARFGAAVAASADGTRVAVGAPFFWTGTSMLGAAYTFTLPHGLGALPVPVPRGEN